MSPSTPGETATRTQPQAPASSQDSCPCTGIEDPIELAACLAPPPGEHELAIPTGPRAELAITSQGIVIRTTLLDEDLPFLHTAEKPAPRSLVEATLRRAGIPPEKLPALALEKLKEAARNGSREAAKKLKQCSNLAKQLEQSRH